MAIAADTLYRAQIHKPRGMFDSPGAFFEASNWMVACDAKHARARYRIGLKGAE